MRSVFLNKLEKIAGIKISKVDYKIDRGSDGNLVPFNILKILFSKATMGQLGKKNMKMLYYECTTKQGPIFSDIFLKITCAIFNTHRHKLRIP